MKKVLCALLAVIMVMSMLIGCGSTEAPAEETKTEAPAETKKEEPAKEETKAEAPAEEAKEWSEEDWLPLSDGETLSVMRSENAKVPDYNTHNFTVWVEEVTGVNIEFLFLAGSNAEKQQQLSLMVAGGEKLPDIIWAQFNFQMGFVNELGRDGYFIDLKPYMEDPSIMPYFNQAISEVNEANRQRFYNFITDPETGSIFTYPHYQDLWVWDNAQTIIYINNEWMKALSLEMPKTLDELHDVLVAFRDGDPNGNGKKDEIPMMGPNGSGGGQTLGYIINAFVYYDDDYHMNATDGKIWAPFTSDEYREALKLMNQWTEEGLIAEQIYQKMTGAELQAITTPADGVAAVGVWAGHPSTAGTDESPVFLEYEWLPYIDQEHAETDKGGWFVWRPGALLPSTMITSDCENVELAVKFCDFFFSDVASTSMRHGIQGKNWDYIDPTVDRDVKNVKVLDEGRAFFDGIDTWGGNTHAIMTNRNYLNGAAPTTEFKKHNSYMASKCLEDADKGEWPEEVVTDVTFNAEEQEYVTQTKTLINDYIDEALAKFGTGVWDPNNDADWNTYLSELEAIGLAKYIECYQAAYDRMK